MPRPILVAVMATAIVLPLLAAPVAGDEPEVEPFVDAATSAGLACEAYTNNASEASQYLCSSPPEATDRYLYANVDPFDIGFHLAVGRNIFQGGVQPAEDDVLALMETFITLAIDSDDDAAEALRWLGEMNDQPQDAGELELGEWRLSWWVDEWESDVGAAASVNLDLYQLQSTPATSQRPLGPEAALLAFLADYGLECARVADVEACEAGFDADTAIYRVSIWRDAFDQITAITAAITSTDASLPSDAIGFLRGVAERAPADVAGALTAWFDEKLAAGTDQARFNAGEWTGSWADSSDGIGRLLDLSITRRTLPTPSPSADVAPAPAATPPPSSTDGAPEGEVVSPVAGEPFADAVPTLDEVSADPVVLLQSAALAVLLVFLMPFPGQLFNSTLEAHDDEVRRWFRLDRLGAAIGGIGAFWASWPGVATFTLLATALYGFLDPSFGLTLDSAATFVGMLVGIVLVTAAFALPAVLAHRRIGDRWTLKVVPVSLLIGVACVLLSRLTGFQPGYLYGLLIGLAFARELSAADEGRATAISAAAMLAVAFVAWVALGAVPAGDGFGVTVLRTALAALMVAGLEGVVFGLLPMRFLPGESLYAWNRPVWAAVLGIGAFAFFHILINPASGYLSDTSRTPLLTVIGLLAGFSLVSVAFWAWFRFRGEPPAEEATAT